MAGYKYNAYIAQSDSDAYDKLHTPGTSVPYSGIFRCQGCGREIAANEGDPFPPQNHHQHSTQQGSIRWRLAVWADHNAK